MKGSERSLAALAAVLLLATGCGAETRSGDHGAKPTGGELVVTAETRSSDRGGYIEGAVTVLTLRREGDVWTQRGLKDRFSFEGLAPGAYELRAVARPCDGACNVLDPPVDGCSATLHIGHGPLRVTVVFRAGHPCEVRL